MKQNKKVWIDLKKLIIILLLLFFILIVVYFFLTYYNIMESKHAGFDKAQQFVFAESDVTHIDETHYFQSDEGYFIMNGKNEQGEEVYVYLLDDEPFHEEKMKIVQAKNVMSKEQIQSRWQQECHPCELIGFTPAMMNDVPLWEITYINENNRYVLEYKTKIDGETYEKLRFARKYN